MDLHLHNQLFIVCGATSGFGKAIAQALLAEGAQVIAVARGAAQLNDCYNNLPQVQTLAADITAAGSIEKLIQLVGSRQLHGMLVNAGGPPAKTVMETSLADWDDAYQQLLRWKVDIVQKCVPLMQQHSYGRIVFIESSSVKQPIENLVLSTSLRLAVVGMVKTLSQEIAHSGVTLNIIGPGSHDTPAINRLYQKKVNQTGMSFEAVKTNAVHQIPVGRLGQPQDLAGIALWLLSIQSGFVTGQTFMVDGGVVKNTL
jgi:3-oxoacyl-[acyl-carrier protein] reductase